MGRDVDPCIYVLVVWESRGTESGGKHLEQGYVPVGRCPGVGQAGRCQQGCKPSFMRGASFRHTVSVAFYDWAKCLRMGSAAVRNDKCDDGLSLPKPALD